MWATPRKGQMLFSYLLLIYCANCASVAAAADLAALSSLADKAAKRISLSMQHLAPPPLKQIINAAGSFAFIVSFFLVFCSAATTANPPSNESGSPDGSPANQTAAGLSPGALPEAEYKIMGPQAYTSLQNEHRKDIPLNRVSAIPTSLIGVGFYC